MIRTVLALALCADLQAQTLAEKIRRAINASPAARTAFWGVQVVDAADGRILFGLNPDHFFVPASNTKLFTTALALSRLGRNYRYQTVVRMDPAGSLYLVGGGDPNLSGRVVPYQMGAQPGNPLQAIEDLADQIAARGIRRIDGDVVGDDTAYQWDPYPPGWGIDDAVWEYGAPVSALTLNDNAISLTILPGDNDGDLARIVLSPALEFYQIDNRIETNGKLERKIHVDRAPGSRQVRIWGTIPLKDPARTELLGIEDPALYAAMALRDALERRGIMVKGRTAVRHWLPDEPEPPPPAGRTEVARHQSAPLIEDLRIIDKVSQNLHAELALLAVGKGRRKTGLDAMKAFLQEAGIEPTEYNLDDGSGLSRLNMVTPQAVVKLLRHMNRDEWIGLLPVGGQDGTLSSRFGDRPAAGRVHAKTGTLSNVSALSGYAFRRHGGVSIFSILVNNHNGQSSEIRGVMDRIVRVIIQ